MAISNSSGVIGAGMLGEQASPDVVGTPRARVSIRNHSVDKNRILFPQNAPQQTMDLKPIGVEGTVENKSAPTGPTTVLDQMKVENAQYQKGKLALAGAQFGLDIMNATTQYRNVEGATRFNILQSKNQAADAIYRGRQAGMAETSAARSQAEDATLAMAAQGQDVQGAGVSKIVNSYEAIGAQNAALAESNAMREALGFELEQVSQNYQLDIAKINRNQQYISAGLNLAASSVGAF
jgi:hypothetical protein